MARKVILTCEECKGDIKVYHTSKALAFEHKQFNNSDSLPKFLKLLLAFEPWDDERALIDGMLHFCTDTCATRRLDSWLLGQRMKVEKPINAEYAEVEPAAPVQESDSVAEGIKKAEIDIPL